jgi:putative nucleotidyltransferase with HDIG domain
MNREEALSLLKENVKTENLVKHCLAVEAIMKKTAEYLQEDSEKWSLVGLLHDIDFEKTKDNPKEHAVIGADMLSGKIDEELVKAIKSHNFEHTGAMPEEKIDYALIASDAVSGLVIACALVMPSKKLNDVKIDTIQEKFKSKDFARNCNREKILYCEKIGLEKDKFFEIALDALQAIADDLGL